MKSEQFDFYSPTNLKSYNLEQTMRYQIEVLGQLDMFTRRHSENVANLCCRICEYLHMGTKFTVFCTICGHVHDLGKLFIPPDILNKPGKLTDEEFEVMKTHTTLGYNMCMKDLKLRPYALAALDHHEMLNGSGYPNGITKKDIPYYVQVVTIADEYDAIVTKRQYKTHVNISETLKDLIKDTQPDPKFMALDFLAEKEKVGKINGKILKQLFKVVIDDTNYEISCVLQYVDYLKDQIKRLELMKRYYTKMTETTKEKTKAYYKEGIRLLLQTGETMENFEQVLEEYKSALIIRNKRIDDLYNEIKIIKRLKV